MKTSAAVLMTVLAMPAAAAESMCRTLPTNPEFPAGLSGTYQIVGRKTKGAAYTGTVKLGIRNKTFQVTRTVSGITTAGSATLEECGMDKIRFIKLRYQEGPSGVSLGCSLDADGDNYLLLSCRGDHGRLEAWFQDK